MAPSAHLSQRGTKRKQSSRPKLPIKQETQAEVLTKKLHHGVLEVRKAAKKAAAFELRKVVKRLKAAREAKGRAKDEDPAELERQLEVLKSADHERVANTALKTKLHKDRLLSQNEDVQAALAEELPSNFVDPQEPGSSAAKVYGRLLSSKTIADAVHAVVNSLKEILDPSLVEVQTNTVQGHRDAAGHAEEEDTTEEEEGEEVRVAERPVKAKKARMETDGEDELGQNDSDAAADDAGWESGTVDGEECAGWESGSISSETAHGVASSSDDDEENDDDDKDNESPQESPRVPRAAANAKAKPSGVSVVTKDQPSSRTAGAQSTFLPSLSVGFTRGDSDASDWSDSEADAADAPRKNRRGQRARRAIWEKKYGKNANHVKKQREAPPPHGSDGTFKREQREDIKSSVKFSALPRQLHGASGAHHKLTGAPTRFGGGGAAAYRSNPGAAASGFGTGRRGAQEADKPLHPSWEAKKKLKEKLNPGIVPAQGKKITFS